MLKMAPDERLRLKGGGACLDLNVRRDKIHQLTKITGQK